MDFSLDTEQTALRDTARSLLGAHTPVADGVDIALWKKLADMGVLGLPFDEQYGGMGAGPVEIMLIAQELGRTLAVVPFIDTTIVAGGLIAAVGSDAQRDDYLPRISDGTLMATLAHAEPRTQWSTQAFGVTATRHGEGWAVSGVKEPVAYGAEADVLIVSARVGDETRLFVVEPDQEAVHRAGYATHDGRSAARLTFSDAAATPLGDGPATAALNAAFTRATTTICAEALGAMEIAVDTTVDYLKARKQFGATLQKFQALTHRAADMYVSLELVRSMVQYASMSLLSDPIDPLTASRAKLQVSTASRHIGKEAIQLHGGIGMTDEYSIGHYASRLVAIDHTYGDGAFHLNRLTAAVGDHGTVELLS